MFKPSKMQEAVYSALGNGNDNLIIQAVAGSGKSTTIVRGMSLVKGSSIFLAFNKSIAEELKARGVNARTFHSVCYSPVLRAIGARTVNDQKISNLIKSTLPESDARIYGSYIKRLVGIARQAGAGCLVGDDGATFYDLAQHHDLELESDLANEAQAIEYARQILRLSNNKAEADFDDLLYFSVLKGVRLPSFDNVFVDEAQDTNALQRAILRKMLARGGRLIAVGDSAQAIYGFRGADSNALNMISEEFQPCLELPLSITYRCSKAVTQAAQAFVPEIQTRDDAPEGEVLEVGERWALSDMKAGDLVVCRNTKPLIDLGFRLLRARIPLRIMGREIGDGLVSLIRKCDSGKGVERFQERLEAWRDREVEKAIAKGLEAKAEAIEDKAEAILRLLAELPEHKRTVPELISTLQSLFAEGVGCVLLATIHKAKGLEADKVWWLCPSLCPSRWARKDWQLQQEHNLMYVAITRAKQTLVKAELPKKSMK